MKVRENNKFKKKEKKRKNNSDDINKHVANFIGIDLELCCHTVRLVVR